MVVVIKTCVDVTLLNYQTDLCTWHAWLAATRANFSYISLKGGEQMVGFVYSEENFYLLRPLGPDETKCWGGSNLGHPGGGTAIRSL